MTRNRVALDLAFGTRRAYPLDGFVEEKLYGRLLVASWIWRLDRYVHCQLIDVRPS